jgi:hypothetical protein
MKVIFLDIDGVLNSEEYARRLHQENPNVGLWDEHGLDPQACALLDRLVEATDAYIVLSSTWRILHPLGEMKLMLKKRGFKNWSRLIDRTPQLNTIRGKEIQAWLDRLGEARRLSQEIEEIESFVILDDSDDMGDLKDNLVLTDPIHGLTEDDVKKAIVTLRMG